MSWNFVQKLSKKLDISHTLTGVWVEILCGSRGLWPSGHTLTGVWVEMLSHSWQNLFSASHPHGCVSWNFLKSLFFLWLWVTPSRVCELKYAEGNIPCAVGCHTLTGVWVEIVSVNVITALRIVTPSRVCELKWHFSEICAHMQEVTPSRVCELKSCWGLHAHSWRCSHTLTGVWVEIYPYNSLQHW